LQRLAERGCRLMQGYLFSRPVSADQFAHLLAGGAQREWRADQSERVLVGAAAGEGNAS
jgi:predicted signal transduction protein with EAL and GGDEF domain